MFLGSSELHVLGVSSGNVGKGMDMRVDGLRPRWIVLLLVGVLLLTGLRSSTKFDHHTSSVKGDIHG